MRIWIPRGIAAVLLVALLALTACGESDSPAGSYPAPAGATSAAPRAANTGQVVISGALSKSFTPVSVEAGTLGKLMVINLHEKNADGVSLSFPPDTKPGTYAIEDQSAKPVVDFAGAYSVFGSAAAFYLSTKGSLTLTAVGSKYSGQFQFTARHTKDASKTIEVSGPFADVPVK
ncbi:MAG: hypothetical protein HZB53_12050 [Chloroflexi bacterium]|nr:hypothetical protein [Chloroflexota bacterium]